METKRIKIRVSPRKTSDGRTFLTFKAVTKNGRLMDCKFNKDLPNIPKEDCWITVPVDQMRELTNSDYGGIYVNQIDKIEPLGTISDAQKAKNIARMNELF